MFIQLRNPLENSVHPLCSLYLSGEFDWEKLYHRDTENTEVAQRKSVAVPRQQSYFGAQSSHALRQAQQRFPR